MDADSLTDVHLGLKLPLMLAKWYEKNRERRITKKL